MDTWALHTELDLASLNLHLAALEAAGLLGISEVNGRATAWLPARVDALPVDGRWEAVADQDWHAAWQARIEPVEAGGLRIAPPWKADPGDIVIEPAQAFGTGHHETTSGCLAALCELELAGRSVLDVGTGTGVLAIAAGRLGAASVVAVDTDPLAVEAATSNAANNSVTVTVRSGSLDAVGEQFDVVVANLDTATLVGLAKRLVEHVAPGGHLIVAGVSRERQGEAIEAFSEAGLPVTALAGEEWVVLRGHVP